MVELALEAVGLTDKGVVRDRNEDCLLVEHDLWVVADGVGGHNSGQLASRMLIGELDTLDAVGVSSPDEADLALAQAIRRANEEILRVAERDPAHTGMATTVTAALHVGGTVVFAQVGDTRAYLKRGEAPLHQLTPEHTYVNALVEAGVIDAEAAKNHPKRSVILRAVGLAAKLDIDTGERVTLQHGDELILVSDGVHGVISDEHLEMLVHGQPLASAVDAVVAAAKEAGGPDNITIVLIRASAAG